MDAERIIAASFRVIGWTTVLGPPLVSRGFTDRVLFEAHPSVVTPFSLALLPLWGVVCLVLAESRRRLPALVVVLVLVKCAFAVSWVAWWLGDHEPLGSLFERSPTAGLFFLSYGPLDALCAAFFGVVLLRGRRPAREATT